MVLYKFGESNSFSQNDFRSAESIKDDPELHERFVKIAANFKKLAPKADDFLYFTAIMMHAAERSLYDENGELKKTADGKPLEAHWEINEKTGSWKWKCNDSGVLPYKNANNDIFPEMQLKEAYKKWVGKPLCKDHQSSSVDGVRGFIVDTYWDDKHKRIISLCALDKITYPDLARKVATGYLSDVSMGTAVGRAICYECGNVARTETEYCNHMKHKTAYGEINTELQPIELSLVVNGADRNAKILEVLAKTNRLEESITKTGSVDLNKIKEIRNEFLKLSQRFEDLESEILSNSNDNILALKRTASLQNSDTENNLCLIKDKMSNIEKMIQTMAKNLNMEELMSQISKEAYMLGTEEPKTYPKEEADKIRNTQDSHMKLPLTDLGPVDGIPKSDLEVKKMQARASIEERRAIRAAAVEKAQMSIKRAYPNGPNSGEDMPKGGYPKDKGAEIRDKEFTINNSIGNTGSMGKDEKVKKDLCRAALKARLVKASKAGESRWEIVDTSDGSIVLSASFDEITGGKSALYPSVATDSFARDMMKNIRTAGVNGASKMYKSAQEPPPPPPAPPAGDPGMAMPPGGDVPPPPADAMGGEAGEQKPVDVSKLQEVADALSTATQTIEEMVGGKKALEEEAGAAGAGAEGVLAQPEQATEDALAALQAGPPQAATAALNTLRIVLNAGLNKAFKKNIRGLKAAKEELELLISTGKTNSVTPEFFNNISREAMQDTSKLVKKARSLQAAFVEYAKGTLALEKRAHAESRMRKYAEQANRSGGMIPAAKDNQVVTFSPENVPPGNVELDQTNVTGTASKPPQAKDTPRIQKTPTPTGSGKVNGPPSMAGTPINSIGNYDMSTPEGRSAYRQKLAATVESKMKYSEMIGKAHPKSDTTLKDIAGTSENVVEGIDTVHEDMMKAVSEEPKVKKAAEQLDKLIKAGKVNAADLDEMVKEGLDKDAVSYWKKYFGQADGGSEFAAALVKDYSNAKSEKKAAEELDNYKAKYAKAYELAYDMAEAGLINKKNSAIKAEADKIVGYDDNAFDSMKRVVAHHMATKIQKTASIQVGVALDSENITSQGDGALYDELVSAFAGRKY